MQSPSIAGRWASGNARNNRRAAQNRAPNADPRILLRALRYVGRYRWLAFVAYGSLFVATAAQLMVPQLIQTIIDTVVQAFVTAQILTLPSESHAAAGQRLATRRAMLLTCQGN